MEIYCEVKFGETGFAGTRSLEGFRSLAADDVRQRVEIRERDPGAKSPHINPVRHSALASIFLLLSRLASPFSLPNRDTPPHYFFLFKK